MKIYLLFLLFAITQFNVSGQYVVIPDTNFLNKIFLIAPSAVSGNMIDTTDAALISIQVLNLNGSNIYDLSGIEYFDELRELRCESNHLTAVPSLLPPLLWNLDFTENPIPIINGIPESVNTFACVQCGTTVINSLPSFLDVLYIGINQLTNLPSLPQSLQIIDCSDNLLDSLPQLPNALSVLVCNNNPIYCLPFLPNSFNQLYAGGTHISCIPNHPINFNLSDIGFTICDSSNTTCALLLNTNSEIDKYLDLEIFPNPTSNIFTIENISIKDNILMDIINVFGEIVFSEKLFGKSEYVIDAKLSSGIYFVSVNDGERNIVRTLIVE